MLILEIVKPEPFKQSQNGGSYEMIKMRDIKTGKYYFTYICPGFRNFSRWRKIARIGNTIWFFSLKMKTENMIDADSRPVIYQGKRVLKEDQSLKELFKTGYLT